MKRKSVDQGPGLFDWAASQPVAVEPTAPAKVRRANRQRARVIVEPVTSEPAPIVDFLARRPTMPRWILGGRRDLQAFDRWLARKEGTMPPAPIISFGRRARPPDAGADGGAPWSRAG